MDKGNLGDGFGEEVRVENNEALNHCSGFGNMSSSGRRFVNNLDPALNL